MAEKWMQKAFGNPKTKGALHKTLGVSQGKDIPVKKLEEASHYPGKTGQRARAALNARHARSK